MNDESKQPLEPVGDDALEARIVAWVLGEASPFEASELEKLCEKEPELALLVRRLRLLDGLIRENATDVPSANWRLPDDKRWRVTALFGDPSKEMGRRRGSMPWWKMAAAIVLLTVILWGFAAPVLLRQRKDTAMLQESSPLIVSYSAASPEVKESVGRDDYHSVTVADAASSLAKVEREFSYPAEFEPPQVAPVIPPPVGHETFFTRNPESADLTVAGVGSSEDEGKKLNDSGIVVAGNRSGDGAVTRNSIDAILNSPDRAPARPSAPVSSMAGVIASNGSAPEPIPVPEIQVPEPSVVLGAGDEYGSGFGGGWGSGGGGDELDLYTGETSIDAERLVDRTSPQYSPERQDASGSVVDGDGADFTGTYFSSETKPGSAGDDPEEKYPFKVNSSTASGWELALEGEAQGTLTEGMSGGLKRDLSKLQEKNVPGLDEIPRVGRLFRDEQAAVDLGDSLLGIEALGHTKSIEDPFASSEPAPSRTDLLTGTTGKDVNGRIQGGEIDGRRTESLNKANEQQVSKAGSSSLGWKPAEELGGMVESLEKQTQFEGVPKAVPDHSEEGYSELAQAELMRRQQQTSESDRLRDDARDAYNSGDLDQAREKYRDSLELLPQAPVLEDRRKFLEKSLADAEVAKAQELRRVGRYDDATKLLDEALVRDPGNESAQSEKAFMEDPVRSQPALTTEHDEAVDQVRRRLYEAGGNYDLGKYDDAKKAYEDVLRTDPYNTAARRGLERVAGAKSNYYRAAYDHTRAELLAEVDRAWEEAVPASPEVTAGPALIDNKLNSIIIPEIDFEDVSVEEALDFLKTRAAELDAMELDPGKKGINFSLQKGRGAGGQSDGLQAQDSLGSGDYRIAELKLKNVPLGEALNYVAEATRLRWSVDDHAVTLKPITDVGEELQTKQLQVPPDFANWLVSGFADDAEDDPFAQTDDSATLRTRVGLKEALEANGVKFPPEATVHYDAETSTLLVRNTPENLDLVEQLVTTVGDDQPVEDPLDLMEELSAEAEPYSTFSLHVSDSSFKMASAAMDRGEVPDKDGIRPEEFYNAFDYGDPAPSAGEPVACVVEQCAHPAFPQRNLMRIAVRTGSAGRAQSTPLNLTLLLDNSGSMERADRAAGVAQAVEQLAGLLKPGDKISVAGFARQPRLLADQLDGADAAGLNDLVSQLPAEGGTNLEDALTLGGELATRQFVDGAQNRVVLFTDGAANLGDADPESLNQKVEDLRKRGIAFDAAGFGADGLNDRLLERLTRNGNGRYYVVDSPDEADAGFANKLAGAFRPAAENVKVQVVFNPERIGLYKLIGFEEHRLEKEDFRNDAVDAAEMASEEAGVALYQFEVNPEGRGEIGEVRVRFRDTATGRMVEQHWTIPYDAQAPSFDQAASSLQLAGLAAFTAEALRGAPMADAVDFNALAPVVGRIHAKYSGMEPVEKLGRMIGQLR